MARDAKTVGWLAFGVVIVAIAVLWWTLGRSQGGSEAGPGAGKQLVVLKFATHPALDELEDSLVEDLRAKLPGLEVIRLNANGDPTTAKQLAESASQRKADLIVTLATPASQAVARTPSATPFIYAAVADPEGAGVLTARSTGIKNAGRPLIEQAIEEIKAFIPSVRRIGTIYNPAEQNSEYVQKILKEICEEASLELEQRTVSDPNQLAQAATQLAGQVDVVFSTNDNTVNRGAKAVAEACIAERRPFVIGELTAVDKGALFGVGVEYRSMGRDLSAMVVKALSSAPGTGLPPPEGPPNAQLWINEDVAQRMKISFPPAFRSRAARAVSK